VDSGRTQARQRVDVDDDRAERRPEGLSAEGAIPGTVSETFDALPAQVDQSTVAPGYLVLDPYSYSQTFNIGAVPAEATLVTLQFTYDFLVQTTPTSSEYAKQSASDTMTIAIAPSAATE
jgi:hypothetical protein